MSGTSQRDERPAQAEAPDVGALDVADRDADNPDIAYRVSGAQDQVDQERERLAHLASNADAATTEVLERVGIAPGWRCLEVGAGSGTISRWMAERVGPSGSVLSVDVDLRFHGEAGPNLQVRRLDATREPLGEAEFDLVHARALLQHLGSRDAVLDKMVAATRPGGWVVVEDADWTRYEQQPLPEPFGTLSLASLRAFARTPWDPYCGRWLLPALQARGLADCDARARVYAMRGGTSSAEWYVAGLARGRQRYIDSGTFTAEFVDAAIAQARRPDFAVLSPEGVAAWGRRPAAR